jgi:hypothetical protein
MCSTEGLRGFPIQNNVPVSDTLNDSIPDSVFLDIQWGTQANIPTFSSSMKSMVESSNTTTLRLQGISYTLREIQIVKPQHKSFLKTENQEKQKAEILLIFGDVRNIVVFCIPLLLAPFASPNEYFNAILQDKLPGHPISASSLLTSDRKYVTYVSCMNASQGTKSSAESLRTFVFYSGLSVTQETLDGILTKGKAKALGFPVSGIIGQLVTPSAGVSKIASAVDYKNFLRTGIFLLPHISVFHFHLTRM